MANAQRSQLSVVANAQRSRLSVVGANPFSDQNQPMPESSSPASGNPQNIRKRLMAPEGSPSETTTRGPHGEKFRARVGEVDQEREAKEKAEIENAKLQAQILRLQSQLHLGDTTFQEVQMGEDEEDETDQDEAMQDEIEFELLLERLKRAEERNAELFEQGNQMFTQLTEEKTAQGKKISALEARVTEMVNRDEEREEQLKKAEMDLVARENEIQSLISTGRTRHSTSSGQTSQAQAEQDVRMDDIPPITPQPTELWSQLFTRFENLERRFDRIMPEAPTPPVPVSRRRRRHEPNHGSTRYHKEVKQSTLNALPGPVKGIWTDLIRKTFKKLSGVETLVKGHSYKPVDQEVALAFFQGVGPGPEGPTQYRFFFDAEQWRDAKWNKVVASNIAAKILEEAEERDLPTVDLEVIKTCILDHAEQIRSSWRQYIPRSGETRADANIRASQQQKDAEERKRIYSRKEEKFKKRTRSLANLLKDANNADRVQLEMAKDIVEELDVDGQSSEYTDNEDMSGLKVLVPNFRRRAIGPLLHRVDEQARASEKQLRRSLGMRERNNAVKRRRITQEVSRRTVVKKLPQSYYDPGFLAGLSVAERELLVISDRQLTLFEEWAQMQEGVLMRI
ncbi:hypothetical protein K435DRAFT_864324 [Dendrothele bispora CBS 962.96]|uniref:Uncharacterized protein n=1 Tax=Dendrothele bispora (strain CBS 962.96) TaxID=1314807 RepID=A0A4S8LN35_DENBC|nr:hypothetical protein K435DRAFT_864324 [Dendrothele bispora CBS 962.96]